MILLVQLSCDCSNFGAILWPLIIAFILGAILGWLLKNLLGSNNSNDEDDSYRKRYLDTKAELDLCKRDVKTGLVGASILGSSSLTSDKKIEDKPKVKKETKSKTVIVKDDGKRDKLTKVEGIGPKIQGLLYDDGIFTWQQLSEVAVERIQKILDDAGPRYKIHNPGSWPKQAAMCAQGEWEKLKEWQNNHKGGRE